MQSLLVCSVLQSNNAVDQAEATVTSMPTISELAAERERLRKKEHELKLKRAKVEAYMGLSPVRVSCLYTRWVC